MVHFTSNLPLLKSPQPKIDKVVAPKTKNSDKVVAPTPSENKPVEAKKPVKPAFEAEDKDMWTIEINPNDWIIRQCTAVCGVDLVNGEIPKEFVPYINDNGNSWVNDHIKKYYKTFIGGHNFFEHVQDTKVSYGFLADATLRKVEIDGNKASLYVDVIVCTNRNKCPDNSVLREIESNQINTLSMGCLSESQRCSKCGTISDDDDTDCVHMKRQIGRQYMSRNGLSKISAIVWPEDANGNSEIGIDFIELSWVRTPAYRGATAAHEINFDRGDKVYFRMPISSINRTDGYDAVNFWAKKGELKIIK